VADDVDLPPPGERGGPGDLLKRLRGAGAFIDLTRLDANYRSMASAAGLPLMPVVKADAYGHGAVRVSRRLESLGVESLGVAYAEEGVVLRRGGVRVPIVVLAGFSEGQERVLLEEGLTPVISTARGLSALLAAARLTARRVSVHVEVDTGMGRLGFPSGALEGVASALLDSGHFDLDGLMTHLATADEDPRATTLQLDRFDEAVARLAAHGIRPRFVHAANSAGLAHLRPSHTLARPGLLLYGLKPRPLAPRIEVRPVMRVAGQIALLKEVPIGTTISYGSRWVASRPSRIGTLPLGYADGVPRTTLMAEKGQFAIRGRRVGVAGTVCMDLTMVDVTDCAEAREGDEAVLFGDDPTAWDVADWTGTSAWDVLTHVGSRLPRVYTEAGKLVAVEGPGILP
jgi:alanine racemase